MKDRCRICRHYFDERRLIKVCWHCAYDAIRQQKSDKYMKTKRRHAWQVWDDIPLLDEAPKYLVEEVFTALPQSRSVQWLKYDEGERRTYLLKMMWWYP